MTMNQLIFLGDEPAEDVVTFNGVRFFRDRGHEIRPDDTEGCPGYERLKSYGCVRCGDDEGSKEPCFDHWTPEHWLGRTPDGKVVPSDLSAGPRTAPKRSRPKPPKRGERRYIGDFAPKSQEPAA